MKKLLAIVLSLVLVLSFSASAFATETPVPTKVPSPTKTVTTEDLPAASEEVAAAEVAAPAEAEVISNEDLTEEQKEAVDEAIEAVTEEGYLPVDSFYVEADGAAVITIELDEGVVVFIVYPDGTIVKIPVEDLVVREDGRYDIPVDGTCAIVIAKEA